MRRIDGKVAMVTGGRRGIGRATAELLAREGARVAITDRKADGAEAVIKAIREAGGEAVFIRQDVARLP